MKKLFFRRINALLLSLILTFSVCTTLIGCAASGNDGNSEDGSQSSSPSGSTDTGNDTQDEESPRDWREKVLSFDFKDYGRGTVNFDEIEYKRPDFDAVLSSTYDVISKIKLNEITFEEQISSIKAIEKNYTDVVTMRSIANIHVSNDSSSSYWNGELSHINTNYPLLLDAVDDMYVASANSPHAERFESEYFGEGLIEQYKDGGKYSDTAIKLLKQEEELELAYTTLSTASVEITYKSKTDTVDNILDGYLKKYRSSRGHIESASALTEYLLADKECAELYKKKSNEISTELFVELIRVRRKIANELGHKTYATYAYEALGRDYSHEEASKLIDGIIEHIVPTYYMLSYTSLGKYLMEGAPAPRKIELHELVNNSYTALNSSDEKYGDIYRYMLQHKLYDLDLEKANRDRGAFETYIADYDAPFIFMSASGDITDYPTLIHEFGHFIDSFVNNNSPTSIDQSEISSQALEYLMILNMGSALSEDDVKYLSESKMLDALFTLIIQGFYAKVEELIYALPEERITKENLDAEVIAAAKKFHLNTKYFNDISSIFMAQTFIYPFYVQSYCVSLIPALDIFFMEQENEGSGFEAYNKLIDRSGEKMTLEESLANAGISSPFDEDIISEIAIKIHAYLTNDTPKSTRTTKSLKTA